MAPDKIESAPDVLPRADLALRIAWIWFGIVGVLLVVGSLLHPVIGPTFENYLTIGVGAGQLTAAFLIREHRRLGAVIAGCAVVVLSAAALKTTTSGRDVLAATAFILALGGAPFLLTLARWRSLL